MGALGAWIGELVAVLARYLIPYFISKSIISLGVVGLTFVGADLLGDYLVDQVHSAYSGLPVTLVDILAMCGAFDWIEIVLTAWVAAIQIKQLRGLFKTFTFGLVG